MVIELMSPAGNIDAFLNAIENGADSVYLGLKKFNARRPAENFTIYNLKKVINIAHQKNKKVYLTLNIDLKSNEIKEIAQILEIAVLINIDAVILKDPAIIYLINKFYKDKIIMHFSTQNAVSSSFGVDFAKKLNVKRVVLARELKLSEIEKACSIDNVECEIFTEGSMCFSISGRCLMSSWVGGRSGNRGICTAPCRVIWETNDKKNPFFSMKDLSLIELLSEIDKAGVSALKIEGRLKNALWIGKLTSIYREAIDNKLDAKGIINQFKELKSFSAREVDRGHFYQHNDLTSYNEDWQNYKKITSEEVIINKYFDDNNEINITIDKDNIKTIINFFKIKYEINTKIPTKQTKAKLVSIDRIIDQLINDVNIMENNFKININDLNLKLTSSFIQKIIKEIQSQIKAVIREEEKLPDLSGEVLDAVSYKEQTFQREKILGDFPDKILVSSNQCSYLINCDFPVKIIVISLINPIDISLAKKLEEKHQIILSIPAVLYEHDAEKMKEYINKFFDAGFKNFEANSYTGISILNDIKCNKSLGFGMPVMNHLAANFFYDLGFSSVYTTPEGDMSVFKSLSSFTCGKIEALVFGKIELFQSRVNSSFFKNGSIFKDKFGIKVECHKQEDLNVFVSEIPFSLINEKIKKERISFNSLTADLRYFNNIKSILTSIFKKKIKDYNTSTFNFYKKLV